MILNEISLLTESTTKNEIQKKISAFLRICQNLFHEKNDTKFYYTNGLWDEKIGGVYSLRDWLEDSSVSHSEKTFFRSLLNRGTVLSQDIFPESEFLLEKGRDKISAVGCLAAYEWESFVISLLFEDRWKKPLIEGTYVSIEEEDRNVSVRNCSSLEHLKDIFLENKRKQGLCISSGKELWSKREELYPHLVFCEAVEKQLEEAKVSMQIQIIMQRLQILEDYFASFNGNFRKEALGYGCRYESESVQKNEKLKTMRKFRTPYGKEAYFYWHISFQGKYPGRIHFIPDIEHKVGIIGFIGKHLPTAKYRTI